MEKCNVMFVFDADTCKPMCVSFVHLLVKHSALQLSYYLEFAENNIVQTTEQLMQFS